MIAFSVSGMLDWVLFSLYYLKQSKLEKSCPFFTYCIASHSIFALTLLATISFIIAICLNSTSFILLMFRTLSIYGMKFCHILPKSQIHIDGLKWYTLPILMCWSDPYFRSHFAHYANCKTETEASQKLFAFQPWIHQISQGFVDTCANTW